MKREHFIIAFTLLVLLVVTAAAGVFQSRVENIPPLSSNSSKPEGARALRLWLAEAGFAVSNAPLSAFRVPEGTDVVLILEPDTVEGFTAEEWGALDEWLSTGGTLVLAARDIWRPLSNSPLEVTTRYSVTTPDSIFPAAPIFNAPPVTEPALLSIRYTLVPGSIAYQPLLATRDGLIALHMEQSGGRVILIADSFFLSNAGLKDPGSAALALNLFAMLPKGSSIWIDEWHHGERAVDNAVGLGPEAWLTGSPAGQAVLFSAAVVFLWLLLAGRPFGRPVPLPQDLQRRSSMEYVTALANLNRRAGHRRALLQYYRAAIKRAYGRRYRLDSALPDGDYVAQLSRFNPTLDGPALLSLLQKLDVGGRKTISEAQMVELAREAAGWLAKIER